MKPHPLTNLTCAVLLVLFLRTTGASYAEDGDPMMEQDADPELIDGLLEDLSDEENEEDLALIGNSFLGDLRYWNGVDSDTLTGKQKRMRVKDVLAEGAKPWGWRYDTKTNAIVRLPGKDLPLSALLRVPEDGAYRIWLRHEADRARRQRFKLKISGANRQEHLFGNFALTTEPSRKQEQRRSARFEDDAVRAGFPLGKCWVWEYWDIDLKEGASLFELFPGQNPVGFSHLFVSRSKTFTPNLSRGEANNLSRAYCRFRVREARHDTYSFAQASLGYHWRFQPKGAVAPVWSVGLGWRAYGDPGPHPYPRSESGEAQIRCGEWTDWLDVSWSTQGAGPWATGKLRFDPLTGGQCDIQLAWHPHPAAVVKTIDVDLEDGTALFCIPLFDRGKGKAVFPDRENKKGVWGVFGQGYLDTLKSTRDFSRLYKRYVEEAKMSLGIAGKYRPPRGIKFVTRTGGLPSEQPELAQTLLAMGIRCIENLRPEVCREVGIEPSLSAAAWFHTSDPADPARPTIVRERLKERLKEGQRGCPDYANLVRVIGVGDEIGIIAGANKINQSVECLKRFREYLVRVLEGREETPEFFGVEDLADLRCLEQLGADPSRYERRLYSHSIKFREVLTADYYRLITEAAKPLFPNARTFANYSPVCMRQGDQTMNWASWFSQPRRGSLGMACGEDWSYPSCSFTGYEIVSYYAALVECAARQLDLPTSFYVVPNCGSAATNIISVLSRGIGTVSVFTFGPGYAGTDMECSWSDNQAAYREIIKATHVAGHISRHITEGEPARRRIALLYNRDHEIMNGGSHGEQSDRALTFAALANANRNADIILNEDLGPGNLEQYSALFLNGSCLPKAAVPAIRDWVGEGGLLIASANSATRDEYSSLLPEMEEIFGAKQCSMSKSHGYITPLQLGRLRPVARVTVQETELTPAIAATNVVSMKTVLIPTTAQPVAAFDDGTCAATVNSLGKGWVLLWGIQPGIFYKGDGVGMSRYADERIAIFEKPLRKVLGERAVSIDAEQVELTRFDLGGETGILVNNFRKYEWRADLPLTRVKVRTDKNITKVSSAMHGELQWHRDGDWAIISFPVPESVDSILLQ